MKDIFHFVYNRVSSDMPRSVIRRYIYGLALVSRSQRSERISGHDESRKKKLEELAGIVLVATTTRDVCRREARERPATVYVTRHVTYLRKCHEHQDRSSRTIITNGTDEETNFCAGTDVNE